jgi:hypothetical protein
MLDALGAWMTMLAIGSAAVDPAPSAHYPIVELRQYTLHPGQRDTLIELFDREFVESQEALGMKLIGQFRDLDNPDRFVWLRGFPDMDSRAAALNAFYSGPVWRGHREAANATMIDSGNVFLLRAPDASAAFPRQPSRSAPEAGPAGLIVANIYHLHGDPRGAARFFAAELAPRLRSGGISVLAWFMPESTTNNFPALPVRENERVLVWFSRFDSAEAHRQQMAAFARSRAWADVATRLDVLLTRPPEVLRLVPTGRSELR